MSLSKEDRWLHLILTYREIEVQWQFQNNKTKLSENKVNAINLLMKETETLLNNLKNAHDRRKCWKNILKLFALIQVIDVALNHA